MNLQKARKKPVEIEYITYEDFKKYAWTKGTKGTFINKEIHRSINIPNHRVVICENMNGEILRFEIPTLEGTYKFTDKDVLIIGVKGEIYPCKKEIFEMTYDKEIQK